MNSEDSEVRLGKVLFNDPRLSHDDTISCASCHDVKNGGDDGRPVAIGIEHKKSTRNSPTVLNAALNFAQFWDGRARTLAEQVDGPIHNPDEMASDWDQIVPKLAADDEISATFRATYPDGLTAANAVRAIVAYEKALVTPDAPFDRFLRGEREALSEEAQRGYGYFTDFGCVSCHQGQNIGGNMYQRFGVMAYYFDQQTDLNESDLGRFNVTHRSEDRFFFKVPGLRNVAQTAPYFHDGSAPTLEDAVRVMAKYQLRRPVSADEVNAIVAFLRSLTGIVDESLL